MPLIERHGRLTVLLLLLGCASNARAIVPDAADRSIQRFLAQDDTQPQYRAVRRLEATNGSRTAWLDAVAEYAPATGFADHVTAEGGSDLIRNKVLKAVFDGERDVIARGDRARSSLAVANYRFQADGSTPRASRTFSCRLDAESVCWWPGRCF